MKTLKIVVTTAALAAIGLGLAAHANADQSGADQSGPPAPSGSDVSSWGSFGDSNMGWSLGMNGYSSSMGGTTLTSTGWPISRTTITGPMGTYDATTDYMPADGGFKSWSSLRSPSGSFDNYASSNYGDSYYERATVRVGSTTIVCHNHMCQVQ
jgi:hypothetical protein